MTVPVLGMTAVGKNGGTGFFFSYGTPWLVLSECPTPPPGSWPPPDVAPPLRCWSTWPPKVGPPSILAPLLSK